MTELLYVAILLVVLLLAYVAQRKEKRIYLFVSVLVLTLAAGLRAPTVGIDTPKYYSHIINHFPNHWQFREEGFRLLSNSVMEFTNNPQYVLLICAFITNLLILLRLWDFKKDAKFSFMVLLYILLFYSNTMNIMRQYVAIALVFYGTRFLKKKRAVLFIALWIIAFFFHRSSLLGIGYIAIYLWGNFSKRQKQIFALPMLVAIVASAVYVYTYLATDFSSYSSQTVSNFNIPYFYRLLIFFVLLILERRNMKFKSFSTMKSIEKKNTYAIDKTIVSNYAIGLFLSALSMFYAFVGRSGLYYLMYGMVFWGIAARKLKNRQLYTFLILVLAIYEFILVFTRNACGMFPYILFFY